jgi:hypothetical protein
MTIWGMAYKRLKDTSNIERWKRKERKNIVIMMLYNGSCFCYCQYIFKIKIRWICFYKKFRLLLLPISILKHVFFRYRKQSLMGWTFLVRWIARRRYFKFMPILTCVYYAIRRIPLV